MQAWEKVLPTLGRGLPWWLSGKEPPADAGDLPHQGSNLHCLRQWRSMKWQHTPGFLPGKSHGQRNLAGHNPWSRKRVGHSWAPEQACTRRRESRKQKRLNHREPMPAWPRNSSPRGTGCGSETMVLVRASQLPRESSMLPFLHGGEGKPAQHTLHWYINRRGHLPPAPLSNGQSAHCQVGPDPKLSREERWQPPGTGRKYTCYFIL